MGMAALAPIAAWLPIRPLVVGVAVVVSLAVVVAVRTESEGPLTVLRRRFVLGVPWGTVLTIVCVAAVYLFVQDAIVDLDDPLVMPFRSWSYHYPLGMVAAAFTHASLGHVTGNLVGTAVFGTVAEYAWSHYPTERGSHSFSTLATNPFVRILVVPVSCFLVGLFTSLFALGPVIGFSGVVFAIAGFALVTRPLTATLAILANQIVGLVLAALQNPRFTAVPSPRITTPWWANIAIQGHAIGLLAGIVLALSLVATRDRWPDPSRLWFGLLAFAAAQGLWAFYVPLGGGRYLLLRWIGTAVVFLVVGLVVVASRKDWSLDVSLPDRLAVLTLERIRIPVHRTAMLVLLVLLATLSGVAVPYNTAQFGQAEAPSPSVEIRDYSVSYGEDVTDGYVNSISIPFAENATAVNTSGVIVKSEERNIWQTVVLSQRLANRGQATVEVGGIGWRRDVFVERVGWTPAGNESVYKVFLRPSGDNRTLAFTSESSRAAPTLGGRTVTIRPRNDTFELSVARAGRQIDSVAVPSPNETTTAGGIRFRRNDSVVDARYNDTRIQIATRSSGAD